jgi:hypothetical protein
MPGHCRQAAFSGRDRRDENRAKKKLRLLLRQRPAMDLRRSCVLKILQI